MIFSSNLITSTEFSKRMYSLWAHFVLLLLCSQPVMFALISSVRLFIKYFCFYYCSLIS